MRLVPEERAPEAYFCRLSSAERTRAETGTSFNTVDEERRILEAQDVSVSNADTSLAALKF